MIEALTVALLAAGTLAAGWYLRSYRARRRFLKATAIVRLTNEMWDIVNAVPPAHLSTPLREAVIRTLAHCADALDRSPLAAYGTTLTERCRAVRQLPRQSTQREYQGADARFTRLAVLLDSAHAQGFLPQREHALARVAAGLAAELSNIDGLCLRAERALTLRSVAEAMQIRAQALKSCNRLPEQTAQETRRRVEARLPLANG